MQIKPLTEEEKKERLAELKARMSEKRAKQAAEEAKQAQANEQIRRKSAKVIYQPSITSVGGFADSLASRGYWEIARRPEDEGKREGYGKEEAR